MPHTINEKQKLAASLTGSLFVDDTIFGSLSGFSVGTGVAFPEAIKVKKTGDTILRESGHASLRSLNSFVKVWQEGAVFPFARAFGGACAIEFSINARIEKLVTEKHGKTYGGIAGIIASGISGAAFLTPADQVMFRQASYAAQHHQGGLKLSFTQAIKQISAPGVYRLWDGLFPMVGREWLFAGSVFYFGPLAAKIMRDKIDPDKEGTEPSKSWNFFGRTLAGTMTAVASQPLDCAKARMQVASYRLPGVKPKLSTILSEMVRKSAEAGCFRSPTLFFSKENALLRGATARVPLATLGGAAAGFVFETLKHNMSLSTADDTIETTRKPSFSNT